MLIDTHCHIHSEDYGLDRDTVITEAKAGGVLEMICIGTSMEDSRVAVGFAQKHEEVFAVVGVHPHGETDGDKGATMLEGLGELKTLLDEKKVVGVGEIGLDYHYKPYDRATQIRLFEEQLQMAVDYGLPVTFHVREAFEDFFAVVDGFSGLKGDVHCFSDSWYNAQKIIKRGFYIGLNGIVTFKSTKEQKEAFEKIPVERLLLETDAPYLTPVPMRGIVNQPAYVRYVGEWVARSRGLMLEEVADITTKNAKQLFNI